MARGFTVNTEEMRTAARELHQEALELTANLGKKAPVNAHDMGSAAFATAITEFQDEFDVTVQVISSDLDEVSRRLDQTAAGYDTVDDPANHRFRL